MHRDRLRGLASGNPPDAGRPCLRQFGAGMATVAAVARGARAAAAGLRSSGGAAARGRPRTGCARRLCTAPAAVDMKRYLWARYHEAKRSTDGE